MKIRGHGNAVSITLAALAVVIAGSGTAVAVTATTTISDPAVPSRIAHVNAAGQLLTDSVPESSTLTYGGTFDNIGYTFLTGPTTASIAITQLSLGETRLNGTTNGSDLTVFVVQTPVGGDGSCASTVTRYIARTNLSSGDHVDLASSTPFVAKPNGTARYCLAISSLSTNSQPDATAYFPSVTFAGYVTKGTYTGPGTGAQPAAPVPDKKVR